MRTEKERLEIEGEKTSKGKAAGQKPRANEGAPEEGACDAVTPCSLKDLVLVYAYASLRREP